MMDARMDTEFKEYTLTRVEHNESGWTIYHGACAFYCPDVGITPKVGDRAQFYGRGIGCPVRGLFLNGQRIFYRTAHEEEQRHRKEVDAAHDKARADELQHRGEWAERWTALPEVFRLRRDGFLMCNPTWAWQFQPYELFVCEEAWKIATACQTGEAIQAYGKGGYQEQRAVVPSLSDQHSGNTHSMAVRLAWLARMNPDLVSKEHGALCPLVGCEDYGCWVTTQKVEQQAPTDKRSRHD